jgi:hypothetical protein
MGSDLGFLSRREMSVFRKLDGSGDTAVMWTPGNKVEEEAAEIAYNAFKAEGGLTYAVAPGTSLGERIESFDPNAQEIIGIRALAGG